MNGLLVKSPSGHVSGARIDHLMRMRATTPRSGHRSCDPERSTTNAVRREKLLASKANLVSARNMHQMKYAALIPDRRVDGTRRTCRSMPRVNAERSDYGERVLDRCRLCLAGSWNSGLHSARNPTHGLEPQGRGAHAVTVRTEPLDRSVTRLRARWG